MSRKIGDLVARSARSRIQLDAAATVSWWSRGDRPADLLRVIGFFAGFAGLDLATRLLSRVPWPALTGDFLLLGAIRARPVLFLAIAVATAALIALRTTRMWAPWGEMEQGRALRVMAGIFVMFLVWEGALYGYNYLLGEAHLADRLLLVALGTAAVSRPVFLGPFALQSRVIASQFSFPFGTTAAQNIDELLIVALLAIAGAHLIFVLFDRRDTAPVLLVLSAAVAAHYFDSGISKLSMGWLAVNEISNLPLNAHTAGWLASGNGGWAANLAGLYETMRLPMLAGTLVIEVGSAVAAAHYRLMRFWLILAMSFHLVLFVTIGFWFLAWIAVEASLLSVFLLPSLRSWVRENATPARALITVGMILAPGTLLFHPPQLAWLDAPIGYGYRIEATGPSGQTYNVPMSAFAPLSQEMALVRAEFGGPRPASGGYGAVGSAAYEALTKIQTKDQLDAFETEARPEVVRLSRELVVRFIQHANEGGTSWSALSPPDHFWTHAPEPSYRFQEPIKRMDIYLLASFNHEPRHNYTRHVLTLLADPSGDITIVDSNRSDPNETP